MRNKQFNLTLKLLFVKIEGTKCPVIGRVMFGYVQECRLNTQVFRNGCNYGFQQYAE